MIGAYTDTETLDKMKTAVIDAVDALKNGVVLNDPVVAMTKAEYQAYLESKITEAYLDILDRLGEFGND